MSNPTNIPKTVTINPNNWYHQHRKEIYELWKKCPYLTTSDAAAMYRYEQGVGDPDGVKDGIDDAIVEFSNYVESLPGDKTEAYFIG